MVGFNFWPFKRRAAPAPKASADEKPEVLLGGTGSGGGGAISRDVTITVTGAGGGGGGTAFYSGAGGGWAQTTTQTTYVFDLRDDHHSRRVRDFYRRAKDARAKKPNPVRKRAT